MNHPALPADQEGFMALDEVAGHGDERFRAVGVHFMRCIVHQDEVAVGQLLAIEAAHLRWDHAVQRAKHHQHWDVQAREAALQSLVPRRPHDAAHQGLLLGPYRRVRGRQGGLTFRMRVQPGHEFLWGERLWWYTPFRSDGGWSHQEQGLYPFWLLHCQPEREFAAERVAHQVEALDAQVGHGL